MLHHRKRRSRRALQRHGQHLDMHHSVPNIHSAGHIARFASNTTALTFPFCVLPQHPGPYECVLCMTFAPCCQLGPGSTITSLSNTPSDPPRQHPAGTPIPARHPCSPTGLSQDRDMFLRTTQLRTPQAQPITMHHFTQHPTDNQSPTPPTSALFATPCSRIARALQSRAPFRNTRAAATQRALKTRPNQPPTNNKTGFAPLKNLHFEN